MKYRPDDDCNNRRHRLFVQAVLLVTLGITGAILGLAPAYSSLRGLNQLIHNARDWLLLWRLTLLMLLIGGWPYLVSVYAERAGLTADQRSSLQAYRWRLALWLLALELIACQALLTHCAETVIALKAGFA